MNDTATPTEATTAPDDTVDTSAQATVDAPIDTASEPSDGNHANREAAKYRKALREAEAARDDALARVAAFQRADVERIAEGRLSVPGDLFTLGGVDLAELLTEDGSVDRAKVEGVLQVILEARPGLRPPKFAQVELGPQGSRPTAPKPDLADLIAGKVRRR